MAHDMAGPLSMPPLQDQTPPPGRSTLRTEAGAAPKRRKVTRACDRCKSRKRRCNGMQPCSLCINSQLPCRYDAPYARGRLQEPRPASVEDSDIILLPSQSTAEEGDVAMNAVTRHPTFDLPASEEPAFRGITQWSRATSPGGDGEAQSGQYWGPTSTLSFLRRASKRFGRAEFARRENVDETSQASIFRFGDRDTSHIPSKELPLPDVVTIQSLLERYFDFAMPTNRFLHQPTLTAWATAFASQSLSDRKEAGSLSEALLLVVLATSLLYAIDDSNEALTPSASTSNEHSSEQYFRRAQHILQNETGPVKLESVQVRLACVLYLLHTSRLSQAWFLLGTTIQLGIALGLHRVRPVSAQMQSCITQECRRRSYWVLFTVDTYLSFMLGRPPLMSEKGVDQIFPTLANDENITAETTSSGPSLRDCVQAAPVFHAKLALIVRDASPLHYSSHAMTPQEHVNAVIRLNDRIDEWRRDLPVFLSGHIHPLSLIPIFRRQLQVLQMAATHAVMLINRSLILMQDNTSELIQTQVDICIDAARSTLDMIMDLVTANHLFPVMWNFQYTAFLALSIVYIWIIQQRTRRSTQMQPKHNLDKLFSSAEKIHGHLAEATQLNAPNLRYSIILDELRQDTQRVLRKPERIPGEVSRETVMPQVIQTPTSDITFDNSLEEWANGFEFSTTQDFWLELDTFPLDEFLNDSNDIAL